MIKDVEFGDPILMAFDPNDREDAEFIAQAWTKRGYVTPSQFAEKYGMAVCELLLALKNNYEREVSK